MAEEEHQSHKEQPIIVKKIKKGGHGHHGGAWKVAYADFVTAMMAFFIVMWILAASNEATKQAISDYFNNPGDYDMLTGQKLPIKKSDPMELIIKGARGKGAGEGKEFKEKIGWGVGFAGMPDDIEKYKGKAKFIFIDSTDMKAFEKAKLDSIRYQQNVEKTSREIRKTLQEQLAKRPDLRDILSSVSIEMTKEGLKIELIESKDALFFEVGSAKLSKEAITILKKLGPEIGKLPNNVEIQGHTDSRKYKGEASYTNWELSADRANAARRILANFLWDGQITEVTGFADRQLRNPANPFDMSNRRVSILVKAIGVRTIMESNAGQYPESSNEPGE